MTNDTSDHGFPTPRAVVYREPTPGEIEATKQTLVTLASKSVLTGNWGSRWDRFLADANNKRWWTEHGARDCPLYTLPALLINKLAESRKSQPTTATRRSGKRTRAFTSPALLTAEDKRAEHAFTAMCLAFDAACVGVWHGQPVVHHLLGPAGNLGAFPDQMLLDTTWLKGTIEQRRAEMWRMSPFLERPRRIMRHRAGQLLCTNRFVHELRQLQKAWVRLERHIDLPLDRQAVTPIRTDTAPPGAVRDDAAVEFCHAVRQFLDTWELLELKTWDLIMPLGPLAAMPVNVSLNGLGNVVLRNVYPSYWPASMKAEGVFARIYLGTSNGLGPIQERFGPQPTIYERAYEMRFAEVAFVSRYGRKRGLEDRLTTTFERRFSVQALRVRQIRSKYIQNLP